MNGWMDKWSNPGEEREPVIDSAGDLGQASSLALGHQWLFHAWYPQLLLSGDQPLGYLVSPKHDRI
jgi:hypothetical protein